LKDSLKDIIKILHLEDTPADAELVERELRKGKIQFEILIVSTRIAFENALKEFAPDIIIADHTLPSFNSTEAIRIIKQQAFNIPFILVTATVSDEYAVEVMKAGADDYILKDRLHRLPQAVLNALEKNRAEVELQLAHDKLVYANRIYSFISHINQAIAHVKDEQQLLKEVCRIATEYGMFKAAWIGLIDTVNHKINLAQGSGISTKDLPRFNDVPYADNPQQNHVMQTGGYYICNNIQQALEQDSWKLFAAEAGYNAVMVLPIRMSGSIIGTFNLYAAELNIFNEGEIALLVEAAGDISFALEIFEKDRQRAKAESNLQTIFDNTSEGFILVDRNGIVNTFNAKTAQTILLNTDLDITIGSSIYDFVHPSRKDSYEGILSNVLAGETMQYDYAYERKNGDTKWFSFTLNPAYSRSGDIEGVCITSADITQRKEAEQKLYESETFNKGVLSSLSSHIAVIDERGTLIAVNKAWNDFAKANGMTSLERVSTGSNYFDVCKRAIVDGDSDAAKAFAGIQSVFNKETLHFEMEYPCHSAEQQRWFILSAIVFGSDEHNVVVSHKDITGRKHAEQSLQQSESHLHAILENTDATIYSLDTDFRYIAFNSLLYNYLKQVYGLEVKIGDHVFSFLEKLDPEEATAWKDIYARALKGETVKLIKEFNIGDFHNFSSFTVYPIWESETIVGLSCFVYDITKQKLEQQQKEIMSADLIQRNRDLEQFTFIVSHNLRAPTANIIGFADILKDDTLTPQEHKEFLQGLSTSVAALDTTIKDINSILQLKGEVNERKDVIVFSKLVDDIMVSIGHLVDKHHVRVVTDFSEVDEIYSLKVYMYSIFYNLISNSIKYSKPNREPLIEVRSKKENGKIILTFKDNGLGIDMKTNGDKIFGLYNRFHTHVEGKGMGLFLVKTQIESIGGTISVESEPNKGTQFTIVFTT